MRTDHAWRTDASPIHARYVIAAGASIVAVVAIVLVTVLLWHRTSFDRPSVAKPFAMASPGPALQTDPAADRQRFDDDKTALLHRYEWIDREHGIVRIPIERAMQRLEQRQAAKEPR